MAYIFNRTGRARCMGDESKMSTYYRKEIASGLQEVIRQHETELLEMCRFIWANPELGLQEAKACGAQVELLKKNGFEITTPFAGLDTAYCASRGTGEVTFAFVSEYDALPEIGHACGHNLICTAAIAAGIAAAELLEKQGLPGRVLVMGTPGEESFGGKVRMLTKNCLDGVDATMMVHPSFRTTPDTGSTAIRRYDISFYGKAAHAAASPELGLNALDAVMLLFQGVNAWRQQLPEDARIHGVISHGGVVPNVIPDHASARFFLRSCHDEVLEQMNGRFLDIVKGAALMTGTREEIKDYNLPYLSRRPNRILNAVYTEAMSAAGNTVVIPERAGRGSSDYGNFSKVRPGAHPYFGISPVQVPAHSLKFQEAAGTAYAEKSMFDAACAMAQAGFLFLTDDAVRNAVLEEAK